MRAKSLFLALALSIGLILATLYLFAGHPPVVRVQGPDGIGIYYVASDGLCGGQRPAMPPSRVVWTRGTIPTT